MEIAPRLHHVPLPVGQVYLWQDPDGVTVVDSGLPGSADAIRAAAGPLGPIRRLFLTHFHDDHAGSAAELATDPAVTVYAHVADAPYLRGERPGPAPVLEPSERQLWDDVQAGMPDAGAEPVRVDVELTGGEELPVGGGARVIAVPGHTPGSAALFLPGPAVLFTGDTIARGPDGTVLLGVFNVDRARAIDSMARQVALRPAIACFGHGAPLTADTAGRLARALPEA